MKIELLHIQGYKSIADLKLENVEPFAIVAGANGAGKSNLVDALVFLGSVIKNGAKSTVDKFGGYSHVHCFKLGKSKRNIMQFEIKITLNSILYHYHLKLHEIDEQPQFSEQLSINNVEFINREKGKAPFLKTSDEADTLNSISLPSDMSALIFFSDSNSDLYEFLTNIRVFRFDPLSAKQADLSSSNSSELEVHGQNVATILSGLEADIDSQEQIMEWLELIVPSMENVKTSKNRLDGSTVLKFKEVGTSSSFPADLISDGTIYALCILTAVFSRLNHKGLTIIEEPERGIHPKAIAELIGFIRESVTSEHPFIITTHNESVVRSANINELWLISKIKGKTSIKNAAMNSVDIEDMPLDKAWLMNMFSGGSPW